MSVYMSIFTEDFLEALSQPDVTVCMAGELDFPSGVTRVHSALGPLTIGGNTYLGVGALGEIGVVTEDGTLTNKGVTVVLNGLDTSIIGTVLNEKCVGRPGKVLFACFNSLGAVISTNVLYQGYISGSGMTAGEVNAVSYTLANVFEKWKDGLPDRYTEESHLASNPGDHIMSKVGQMAERPIYWGSKQDALPFARY